MKEIKVLAIGDIIGKAGRNVLEGALQSIVDQERIDFIIVNGENSAGGMSITPKICQDYLSMGVDVITTGNHIWDNKEVYKIIDSEPALIRPANYPENVEGKGFVVKNCRGVNIAILNPL